MSLPCMEADWIVRPHGANGAGERGPRMQLKDLSTTLIRRWYLVLLALVCAAIATFLTVDKVGPTYEAKAAVLLLPPVATVQHGSRSETTVGNPYLLLDGLSQIRDILIRTITAQA